MTINELCDCCLSVMSATIVCVMDEDCKVLSYEQLEASSADILLSEVVNFTFDEDNTLIIRIKENNKTAKQVKYPCCNCVYYNTCGESGRTHPCSGRKTKREGKTGGK